MYIADLHIHSKYSRATSRDCTPEYLDLWARKKGIHIVGTGDFTHPAWREELREKLEPAEDGFYVLKDEYRIQDKTANGVDKPRFVVTGEISSIYKKNGRVRKVHNLILLPSMEEAQIAADKLETIGNIHSDGRPILGVDSRDLLEIFLEQCPEHIFVPAHIWTPHFSLFGAFSGFDSVEECFDDMLPCVHAVETGLSSDPPMNWRVSALDKYQLISNSDAHSPAKLGREANLLDIDLSYKGLKEAIETGNGLSGTLEFYPEEGKYHFDGHRKCGICLKPAETEQYNGRCPVCQKKLTIGVSHRVEQLADREEGFVPENAKNFESLVPLPEVIGACTGHSSASTKVQIEYHNMLAKLGPEFEILRKVPIEDIRKTSGYLISEGIRRLREQQVERIPGFDGEYGTIKLFEPDEIKNPDGQMSLFDCFGMDETPELNMEAQQGADYQEEPERQQESKNQQESERQQESDHQQESERQQESKNQQESERQQESKNQQNLAIKQDLRRLNPQQQEAVEALDRITAVIAGPGTGKTKTLVSRILYLLENRKVKPSEITAVTFTNKAAAEMRERLGAESGKKAAVRRMQIGTFHSICLRLLKEQNQEFTLANEMETTEIAKEILKVHGIKMKESEFLRLVSLKKNPEGQKPAALEEETIENQAKNQEKQGADHNTEEVESKKAINRAVSDYKKQLQESQLLDFDDLLLETMKLLEKENATKIRKPFSYLLVDEFQDISHLQYRLIQSWNRGGRELFVIGDPDQSIYGFRGSDAACFTHLKNDFPDTRVIRLLDNYRSTPQIIEAAMESISHNPGEKRSLVPKSEGGPKVRLYEAGSEMGEAIFAAKEINRLIGGIDMLDAHGRYSRIDEKQPRSFADIAILYRTHRQADLLEKALKTEGIPYVVAGRDEFLLDSYVRGTICFFRSLSNPQEETMKKMAMKLIWDMEWNEITETVYEEAAERYRPITAKGKPYKILEQWIKERKLTEKQAMKKLQGMAGFYKKMEEFLDVLCLGVESDLKRSPDLNYKADTVALMTLHGSKGLEFPSVILYGIRKGMLPLENEKHPSDIEEERRLFYVGMTRAKEELILTTSGEKSAFLDEIPEEMITVENSKSKKAAKTGEQLSLFDFI